MDDDSQKQIITAGFHGYKASGDTAVLEKRPSSTSLIRLREIWRVNHQHL